jgi:hypothetical protein
MMNKANFVPWKLILFCFLITGLIFNSMTFAGGQAPLSSKSSIKMALKKDPIMKNAAQMLTQGREIFRFDTFGDEQFWEDALHLHQAIEGQQFGGVGAGLSPAQALELGLKVDVDALPQDIVQALEAGQVDLNDVAVTLALLKLDAVVGVKGTFNGNSLQSVGITCALCHSTVDDSLTHGVGHRLDGWANRDLNVGAIIAFAPTVQPLTDLLKIVNPDITDENVRTVLNSWGPGKFDAELVLDGKASNPQQVTNGVVTATNVPGATLLPNAYGLAGFNQHTWTGDWGSIPYWNAFVAILEMHGVGNFFDPRLDNAAKFPIAAAKKFGHITVDPDEDLVTAKLPPLHLYQLSLPAPQPRAGIDFDEAAAKRGDELFSGKANCTQCHAEPLWTDPGWNLHTPAEMKIDAFQANRAPGDTYKTMNLAGLFVREEGLFMKDENAGRFYHDGRFKTLLDVVDSYNARFDLKLTDSEEKDLVEYLKSL